MEIKNKPYAITGSIATGKSSASNYLRKKGFEIIDADEIAKKLSKKGEKIHEEITKHFGENYLLENGEIDRKKLGQTVFSDREKLEILSSISHPLIFAEIKNQISKLSQENKIYFLDIPLLFETGAKTLCEKVILIYTSKEVHLKRLMNRDNIDEKTAINKINSQMTLDEKVKLSDIIINNDKDLDNLYKSLDELIEKLQKEHSH